MEAEKKLPPGELLTRTLAALAGGPPMGLEISQVAALIGRSYGTAKTTLWRLENRQQCWRISVPGYAAAYFGTEAARDAARAEVSERFAKVGRERHEAARLRQRARERVRDGRPPDAPARPGEQTCSEFLVDYLQAMLPAGVSLAQATEASGKSYHSVKKSMGRLVLIGEHAWSVARPGFALYFGSMEARDAAAAELASKPKPGPQAKKPKAPKKPRLEREKRYEFRRADLDAQPKPKVQPKVTGWETAKVTLCPPCQVERFRPNPGGHVIGDFYSEWLTLRGKPAPEAQEGQQQ